MLFGSFSTHFWQNLHYNNIFILAGEILFAGGWFFVFYTLLPIIKDEWINWRQGMFSDQNPYVTMEVSIPAKNKRNIGAIEQIFSQIQGLRRSFTWWEKWWRGQYVLKVVFEVVSFEGQIKYFISSTHKHRNLVEHAVYSQYPDAQIKVLKPEEDFKHMFPDQMPDPEFDLLGTEYVLFKPDYYPIKTYKDYEKPESGEHLDPLRHVWELMSHLKEGEYLWYQIIIVPESEEWSLKHRTEADKLIGKHRDGDTRKSKSIVVMFGSPLFSIIKYIVFLPIAFIKEINRQVFKDAGKIISSQVRDNTYAEVGRQLKGTGKEAKNQIACLHEAFLGQFRKKRPPSESPPALPTESGSITIDNQVNVNPNINVRVRGTSFPSDYLFMSDKQKRSIDAIERKLAQPIFKTCLRVLYIAKKPVFSKFRFWSEMHGTFRHFNDLDYNIFTRGKYTKTTSDYFFAGRRKRRRQNSIIFNTKERDWYAGDEWMYFSSEELATIWHFPRQEDMLANFSTAPEPRKPLAGDQRVSQGYKKEQLVEVVLGEVPANLPVTDYEPYNYK